LTPASGTGHGLTGAYHAGTDLSGPPLATATDPDVDFDWKGGAPVPVVPRRDWSARWTGTLTAPATGTYTFSLTSDDGSRLTIDGEKIIDRWKPTAPTRTGTVELTAGRHVPIRIDYRQGAGGSHLTLGWRLPGQDLHAEAVAAARTSDVAVVFAAQHTTEGADLPGIGLPADQNRLIADVAAANPRTIVVINSGSAVTMPWAGKVPAIIEAWYPGQEYGTALAALLFGDENFSGRLPVTFPRSLADVPARDRARFPGGKGGVRYDEGIDVGYRWYDRHGIAPRYPFGFGLSYTTFGYTDLTVSPPAPDGRVTISFTVENTGTRDGAEIAQVYAGKPAASGEPPRTLAAFRRIPLRPGQRERVTIVLPERAFQHWDGRWTTAPGTRTVSVGPSSRDLPLTGAVPASRP
ncbi:glycoside hydrolase family 3 C-terminal domain-containing protein, partial [Actinocorallia lasiicapitis]